MTELLLPYANLIGWIGFLSFFGGFMGIILRTISPQGKAFPLSILLAALGLGTMNYTLGIWPGFWMDVLFSILGLCGFLASIGRMPQEITDEKLDAMCDEIEKEKTDDM